jgi:plasmid stabilization system protein ParE
MNYRIEISSIAEAEVDHAFLQMSQITSVEKARYWQAKLLSAIESLAKMPNHCPPSQKKSIFQPRNPTAYVWQRA